MLGHMLVDVEADGPDELWMLAESAYQSVFGRPPAGYDPRWMVEFLREYHSDVPDERTVETVTAVHTEISRRWPWLTVEARRQTQEFATAVPSHRRDTLWWLPSVLDAENDLVRDGSRWVLVDQPDSLGSVLGTVLHPEAAAAAAVTIMDDALVWMLPGARDLHCELPWNGAQVTTVTGIDSQVATYVAVSVHEAGVNRFVAPGFARRMRRAIERSFGEPTMTSRRSLL